jgi:phage shock protein A
MSLFNRVNDIIQSNMVAMLDKAENPEKLLNLMQTELQDALSECRGTAADLLCEKKALKRQIAIKEVDLVAWQNKAERAVAKHRDDLAKAALLEKQRINEVIAAKNAQCATLKAAIDNLAADCQRLQQKIAQVKTKQARLIKRQNVVVAREKVNTQLQSDKIAQVLARFQMIEQKVEGVAAQVAAYELGNATHSTAEQIELLVKNEKIDAELARLKASVKHHNNNTSKQSV